MSTPLGKRLRQYREAKGLTLQQVADAVGCTKAYIWELEMREGQRPTAERLNAIAKTLGVTVLHLLGEPIGGIEDPSPADVGDADRDMRHQRARPGRIGHRPISTRP